jgi:hypothetical protein
MHALVDDALQLFYDAIRRPKTRYYYELRWKHFLKWIRASGKDLCEQTDWFVNKAKNDTLWAESLLIQYARDLKTRAEREHLSGGTVRNYFKPIWLCLEQNGVLINEKRIRRTLPKERNHANDRAPTVPEINRILSYPDRRVKPAVLIMLSSGIRVGSWDHMDWGHIKPIPDKEGNIIAAGLYACDTKKDDEWYDTFISPEAYLAAKEYMDYRASCGEVITSDSPVLRNRFDASSHGLVSKPRRLGSDAVKNLLGRVLKLQGIRGLLPDGKHRHEFQVDHGFRKFFETQCKASGMQADDVEWLLNHYESYHRPESEYLLQEYVQAIPKLTINDQIKAMEKLEKVNELQDQFEEFKKQYAADIEFLKKLAPNLRTGNARQDEINHRLLTNLVEQKSPKCFAIINEDEHGINGISIVNSDDVIVKGKDGRSVTATEYERLQPDAFNGKKWKVKISATV